MWTLHFVLLRPIANYSFRVVRCSGDDSGVPLWGRPYSYFHTNHHRTQEGKDLIFDRGVYSFEKLLNIGYPRLSYSYKTLGHVVF